MGCLRVGFVGWLVLGFGWVWCLGGFVRFCLGLFCYVGDLGLMVWFIWFWLGVSGWGFVVGGWFAVDDWFWLWWDLADLGLPWDFVC